MDYISTRGQAAKLGFSDVLLEGLATDGGLYMPCDWPKITKEKIAGFSKLSYLDTEFEIIKPFIGDALSDDKIRLAVSNALYSFHHKDIAPLTQIDDNTYLLELFHGPTLAFKDHALQLLGQLFDLVLEERNERVTIVGATSGDTGSAAIEACKKCKGVNIFILHPKGRVSDVQRKQMTTVDSNNVFNIAIDGDFDDCQNLVKRLFADEKFRRELNLSAINSINWARIMAQIVYYFRAYSLLGSNTKEPCFVVPTGNFGNIFAGFAASKMGLPIKKLVAASNANDILTRFFETSIMQKHKVIPSLSPSMDIQVSSNFERLLFELYDRKHQKLLENMQSFGEEGRYQVDEQNFVKAKSIFDGVRCDDEQTKEEIKRVYQKTGLLVDPHTAVGIFASRKQDKENPVIVLSTAHPAKFPEAVKQATGQYPKLPEFMSDLFDKKEKYQVLDNDIEKLKNVIKSQIKGN